MTALSDLLRNQSMSLLVSLPENSLSMVEAAKEGGADVIKVHMNVDHRASGTTFGSLEENKDFFKEMNRLFTGTTGVVIADTPEKVVRSELEVLEKLGFQFISLYAEAAPTWLLNYNQLEKMLAISYSYKDRDLLSLNHSNVEVLEASVMHPDQYGLPLTINDIFHYRQIISQVKQPVIIPTQKNIETHDLCSLQNIGVKGLMIGAIVTGKTPEEVYTSTKSFKQKIQKMRK